ncbi:MAG: hypothetical protein ACM31L_20370 [Actinomycetota bacterium]
MEIGPAPRIIAVPVGGDGQAYLRRQAGESGWIAVGADNTWLLWRTSLVQSPAPQLLFRFADGGWRLAADLMRKPPPSPQRIAELARRLRDRPEWKRGEVPPLLWATALDLAYQGNLDAADRLFDQGWRPEVSGKADFHHAMFACRLRTSPVWPEISAMNGRPAAPPEGDCED